MTAAVRTVAGLPGTDTDHRDEGHSPLRRRLVAAIVAAVVAHATRMAAAASPVAPPGAPDTAGAHVALVIGNASYPDAPLKNAVADAQLMAATLTGLGYATRLIENASHQDMLDALAGFVQSSRQAAARLLYFSGHGAQYRGRNYLLPVDARLHSEDDLPAQAVDAHDLADRMSRFEHGVSLMLLDACRAAPGLRRPTRGQPGPHQTQGLAGSTAPRGTLIFYATGPDQLAEDDPDQPHSTFTRHLAEELRASGVSIEVVIKRVRQAVLRDTAGRQTPWDSSSLVGDFCFRPAADGGCGS